MTISISHSREMTRDPLKIPYKSSTQILSEIEKLKSKKKPLSLLAKSFVCSQDAVHVVPNSSHSL